MVNRAGRRNLVLFLAHNASCSECRQYMGVLARSYPEYRHWDTEVVALVLGSAQEVLDLTCRLNLPYPAVPDGARESRRKLGLLGDAESPASQMGLVPWSRVQGSGSRV